MILRIKELHPLTVSAQGGRCTDPYTGTHRYAPGVTVPLNAWDNVPWYFDHWSGDLDTTDRQTSIVMNGPKSVTAVFKEKYTLALTFQNEGFNRSVNLSTSGTSIDAYGNGQYLFDKNSFVTLTPNPSNDFKEWHGDVSTFPFTTWHFVYMTGNKNVTAVFKPRYTLTVNTLYAESGDSVKVNNTTQTASYATYSFNEGDQVTLDPAPDPRFYYWQGQLFGSDNCIFRHE